MDDCSGEHELGECLPASSERGAGAVLNDEREQRTANPSDEREAEELAHAKAFTRRPLKLIEAILNKHHTAIVSELHVQVDRMVSDLNRAIDALGREPGESLIEWEARALIVRDYLRGQRG